MPTLISKENGNRKALSELHPFEEAIGEFVDFQITEDSIVVGLRNISSLSIPLPRSASEAFHDVKRGDRIGILRTDDKKAPVRIRRL